MQDFLQLVQDALMLFSPPATLAAAIVAGILGLLVGSFLNVVIHRLPIMFQRELDNYIAEESGKDLPHTDSYNLVVPRSACPHCGHRITALENIPVLSWLVLRGKCRACKAPISARYPIIEAVSGLLSGWLVWQFGSGWIGMATLVFAWLLLAMTFIDIDTQILPDDLTYPLLWLGLLVNLNGAFTPLRDAVLGAVAGFMVLWTVNAVYKLVRRQEGMGGGDFKLLAALGAWMGWQMLPAIILLSSAVGAVVGIAIIIASRLGFDHKIPFGPYLAGAGLLALVYGQHFMALTYGVAG